MAYELVHGRPCFRGDSMEQLHLRIKHVKHSAFGKAEGAGGSPAFRAFVLALLVVKPPGRMHARAAPEHAWLAWLAPVLLGMMPPQRDEAEEAERREVS